MQNGAILDDKAEGSMCRTSKKVVVLSAGVSQKRPPESVMRPQQRAWDVREHRREISGILISQPNVLRGWED